MVSHFFFCSISSIAASLAFYLVRILESLEDVANLSRISWNSSSSSAFALLVEVYYPLRIWNSKSVIWAADGAFLALSNLEGAGLKLSYFLSVCSYFSMS
jgi:hypothetical protein